MDREEIVNFGVSKASRLVNGKKKLLTDLILKRRYNIGDNYSVYIIHHIITCVRRVNETRRNAYNYSGNVIFYV